METETDFTVLLPDVIEPKPLEEVTNPSLWVEANVARVRLKAGKIKYAIKDVLQDVWQAHELLVRNPVKGWSWRRYCQELGVGNKTPLRWFQKYGLDYTITRQPLTVSNDTVREASGEFAGENPSTVIVDEGTDEVPVIVPEVMPRDPAVTEIQVQEAIKKKEIPTEGRKRLIKVLQKSLPKKPKEKKEVEEETPEDLIAEFNDTLKKLKDIHKKLSGDSLAIATRRVGAWAQRILDELVNR